MRSKGVGFSLELNKSNSNELVIPEGLGQSKKHGNHSKELMEPSQSCAPKTKPKSVTNKHKNDEIGSIQKPRGHKEDGASFPNQIQNKVSQIHNQILL